jgi:hypothetical protein
MERKYLRAFRLLGHYESFFFTVGVRETGVNRDLSTTHRTGKTIVVWALVPRTFK